jgi:hypothetical protein
MVDARRTASTVLPLWPGQAAPAAGGTDVPEMPLIAPARRKPVTSAPAWVTSVARSIRMVWRKWVTPIRMVPHRTAYPSSISSRWLKVTSAARARSVAAVQPNDVRSSPAVT